MHDPRGGLIPDDILEPLDASQQSVIKPVLDEQAADLVRKVKGKLQAEVITRTAPGGKLEHSFYLRHPDHEDFRYLVFWIQHGLDDFPATLFIDSLQEIRNEAELDEALRQIFGSIRFKRLIQAMLHISI